MKKYESINNKEKICFELINKCPICSSSIVPVEKSKFLNKDSNMYFLTFECPACNKGFISYYNFAGSQEVHNGSYYDLLIINNSYPKETIRQNFDDSIVNLSESFCEIYNQAYKAEQTDLNEIAGMGYRKAIEFLIKDYCISKNKDEAEKIKSELLSQVITDYIDSDKIKNLAKASAWLGNDETHYVRKHEGKDVEDLKKFISATVAYITYELIADSAEEFVNN